MNSESDYALAWADLRRRRRINWMFWLGFIPIGVLAAAVHDWLRRQFGFELFFPVIMLPWMCAIQAAAIYEFRFRCPRCHRTFKGGIGVMNLPWLKQCAYCGLKEGTPHDPKEVDEEVMRRVTRTERKAKRFSRIFLIASVTILVAIAVITSIAGQRLKAPQAVVHQFMQRVQKDDFRGAYQLFSANGQEHLKPGELRKLWQTFELEHGNIRSWAYAGSYNLPTLTVTMVYRLKGNKGKEQFLRIALRKLGENWRIESVALQDEARATPTSNRVP